MDLDRSLSIIAIILSIVSLGWQSWTWRRHGEVVTISRGMTVVTGPAGLVGAAQVTAANTGHREVTVTEWGYELPNGDRIVPASTLPGSADLPHLLVPNSHGSWLMPSDDLLARCWEVGARHHQLRAYARLSNGRTIRAGSYGIGLTDDQRDG